MVVEQDQNDVPTITVSTRTQQFAHLRVWVGVRTTHDNYHDLAYYATIPFSHPVNLSTRQSLPPQNKHNDQVLFVITTVPHTLAPSSRRPRGQGPQCNFSISGVRAVRIL
jgi:hypothetical protein